MKLSELIPHTSKWTGIPETQVRTVAHELRPAGLISSGGRGGGGAAMSDDDKVNLLLGVCGVEVAKRAAEHVRVWRRLIRITQQSADYLPRREDQSFAFLEAQNVRDFIVNLITKDLNGGPLERWLKEADDALSEAAGGKSAGRNHEIALDFYVDEFVLKMVVSRYLILSDLAPTLRQSKADNIEVTFIQPAPDSGFVYQMPKHEQGFLATSSLIRRLTKKNLVGWGTCLSEDVSS